MIAIMILLAITSAVVLVYACLTAASNEDDWMEDYWKKK